MAAGAAVIVIGIGGMGSAITYHLARRGAAVLGIEQFTIPNSRGSSHGLSRIIRLPYWEHDDYVPLVIRARDLWKDLEQSQAAKLLVVTGSLDAGPSEGRLFAGALRSAQRHDLRHQVLSSHELSVTFPAFRLPEGHQAVYQPEGGYLIPEQCICAHVTEARRHGAVIKDGERVLRWMRKRNSIVVRTDLNSYSCDRLVITTGPWLRQLSQGGGIARTEVERQVVIWTEPRQAALVQTGSFPVFYLEVPEGRFYGFPTDTVGFKIGKYNHRRQQTDPNSIDRVVTPDDDAVVRTVLRYIPAGDGPTVRSETCMFTNTPDEHFLIGSLPNHEEVLIAGGFSGHGFKFCSVVGEILADLVLTGSTSHKIDLFRPERQTAQGQD